MKRKAAKPEHHSAVTAGSRARSVAVGKRHWKIKESK
jgi:hypothetical protein